MLFDLHMHSRHSHDSRSRVEGILRTARARGLAGVAITDHESFEGSRAAARLAERYGVLVIPAMEVATEEGDVIGLFLRRPIESRSFEGVVAEIRAQDGLVYYPHPFKRRRHVPEQVIERVDVLEVFNARGECIGDERCNARAEALARRAGVAMGAGSDAHFLWEIGRGCVDLGEVGDLEAAKQALRAPHEKAIRRQPTPLVAEVASQLVKAARTGRRDVWRSAVLRLIRTAHWVSLGRLRLALRRRLPWLRPLVGRVGLRVHHHLVRPLVRRDLTRRVRRSVDDFLLRCSEDLALCGPLLEVGPADASRWRRLLGEDVAVETLDHDPDVGADHVGDVCAMPGIPSDHFGTVVCTEVLEHVRDPFAAAAEITRVLRPGGLCLVTTPFNLRIHGPAPDCWRFTEEGLRTLFAGRLEVVSLDAVRPWLRREMPIHYRMVLRKPASAPPAGA